MVPFPHPPPAARAGLHALARADARLAKVEAAAGPLPWRTRPAGFPGLLQTVMAQQISSAAAAAIWGRLRALPGALTPAGLLLLSDEALRGAGLSRPKVAHARALATAFDEGRLRAESLAALGDGEAVAAITAVRGLGPWTAEVYLLFALGHPDIFPAGDLALQEAARLAFDLDGRPKEKEFLMRAGPWRPHRAAAARVLWAYYAAVKSGRDGTPV